MQVFVGGSTREAPRLYNCHHILCPVNLISYMVTLWILTVGSRHKSQLELPPKVLGSFAVDDTLHRFCWSS